MFTSVFESLYNKVFVNIVVDRVKTTVYIERCSKNSILSEVEEVFNTTSITKEMKEFISLYISESPFHYISVLDTSSSQGGLPTCVKNKIPYYEDLTSSVSKCFDKKWTYYTSQEDLYLIERKYEKVGIDFIFSPFVLLTNFFKDKIDNNIALFVVIQDSCISLSIFSHSELLYAKHLDLVGDNESEDILMYDDHDDNDEIEIDEGIDLEGIDALEDIDSFDDFGDIEDLDSIEDNEDFLETADAEEAFHENMQEQEMPVRESESFNEDYQRFLLIQSAINDFYNNSKFEGLFVQNIYMADGIGVSQDLKRYLEEEMFMDVYTRQLDLPSAVCELAKMELGL